MLRILSCPTEIRINHQLVLVGDLDGQRELQVLVKQAGIERQTIWAGVVPDEQLVALYQFASVFVFPSLYEGFGLPSFRSYGLWVSCHIFEYLIICRKLLARRECW